MTTRNIAKLCLFVILAYFASSVLIRGNNVPERNRAYLNGR